MVGAFFKLKESGIQITYDIIKAYINFWRTSNHHALRCIMHIKPRGRLMPQITHESQAEDATPEDSLQPTK